MIKGKRWLSSLVILLSLAWSGGAHASVWVWYLLTRNPPESVPESTRIEIQERTRNRIAAEDCGSANAAFLNLPTLIQHTTLVFQDTENWLSHDSRTWCNSEFSRNNGGGFFKGVTYVRKDPAIAFYVMKSGSLVAVPWSKVKNNEYTQEILNLTGKRQDLFLGYQSILSEANRRDGQKENTATDCNSPASCTPR